jgi:hypothetical protein
MMVVAEKSSDPRPAAVRWLEGVRNGEIAGGPG